LTTVFEIGDLLAKGGDMAAQAVVLDKTEDGARLLLMTLPAGEALEIAATEASAWTKTAAPIARWVEVYEAETPSPFFAAYVPDIHAAIAVYRAFEAREGDFKVEIYTSDDQENEMLDGIGYFG
jgi:hypothetical protein